ncbi:hypothetical protein IT568_00240 [bacterium]|nr:hypothetical protein [bacterium]
MNNFKTYKTISLPFIYAILIISLIGVEFQQQIHEDVKVVIQLLILSYCAFSLNAAILSFFVLNFFFRNYFNDNLFGMSVFDPFSVISLMLLLFFFFRGILFRRGFIEHKLLLLLILCFLSNAVYTLRFWIFEDFMFTSNLATHLTNFLVFPISIIFFTNQIFKNTKEKEQLESLNYLLVGIVIFSFFFLLNTFLITDISTVGSVENELWNNPLLGHKNTYGPFFVILFFSLLHLYNFEVKNKLFIQLGIFSCLAVIIMSISRNAYASLILVNGFLIWKGILINKKSFITLILGGIIVFLFAGGIITERTETIINPLLQGNIGEFQDSSSGHFTNSAFEQVGTWLVRNPFFGGFFNEYNNVESGWTELIRTQGLVGLSLYILLLFYFHSFFHLRIYSKDINIKKYSLIGYTTIICVYSLNTTDYFIYTYSTTPLVFWLTFSYLAVLWCEKQDKLKSLKRDLI